MSQDHENLKGMGINIGFLVAGMAGALVFLSKSASHSIKKSFFAIVCGALVANYLTEAVVSFAGNSISNYSYAIAFLLGVTGKTGVLFVIDKILNKFHIEIGHHKKKN